MMVHLRRHAPTRGNLQSRYIGASDQPVAPEGYALLTALPCEPLVRKVYVSSLLRTRQTAACLYPNAEIVAISELNEMNFGTFETRSWQEMEHDPEYRRWVDSGCELPCPGGESREEFSTRCAHAFSEILASEYACGSAALHLVVHGGTIMALLSRFALPERGYFDWKTGYCQGFILACADPHREKPLVLTQTLGQEIGGEPA